MRRIYPWLRELALKIEEKGETWLIEKTKEVHWNGTPELLRNGDRGIEPFSFIYSLAQKNTTKQRPLVYPSVAERFELTTPLPDLDNADIYMFPTPPPMAPACFNDRKVFRPKLLWRLFRQAVRPEPRIDPSTFEGVLTIKYVKAVKLTQALFLINPDYFVPADSLQYVSGTESMDRSTWNGYKSAMDKAKQTFPGCRADEINLFLFCQYQTSNPP